MSFMEDFNNRRVKHVKILKFDETSDQVRTIYKQLNAEFQIAPPMTVHAQVPEIFAAVWSACRESLVVGDHRTEKEIIATKISNMNNCPYCVDIHAVMIGADSNAVNQKFDLELWASQTLNPQHPVILNPPFSKSYLTAYLGTAIMFHYINRVVNVFMREGSPLNLPTPLKAVKPILQKIASATLGKATLKKKAQAGLSLELTSPIDFKTNIQWIDSDSIIGKSLARFFYTLKVEARTVLHLSSIQTLEEHLKNWNGENAPLGRGWLEEVLLKCKEEDRVALKLALLVARSSHQITDADIHDFRKSHSKETDLIKIVSWAASAASFRISQWLQPKGI